MAPGVALTASAGLATNENEMRGAQFSAPGLGTSNGVNFATSVTGGTATRWALQASQPLINPVRSAQQQQLGLQADMTDLNGRLPSRLPCCAPHSAISTWPSRRRLQVLDRQLQAVQKASTEAQDRYELGSLPITDTHEARARLAGLRAQRLAAQTDLDVKRRLLADSTGLPASSLAVQLPSQATGSGARDLTAGKAMPRPATRPCACRPWRWTLPGAEAHKHSLRAAATVDLVAQAGRTAHTAAVISAAPATRA